MKRREFSTKIKLAAWQRSGGKCETCTRKLAPGDIHYDHVIPDGLGGEPTLDNCAVLCRSCHAVKTTTQDVPAIAKSKRVQARHAGAKAPSARRILSPPRAEKPTRKTALPPRPLFVSAKRSAR